LLLEHEILGDDRADATAVWPMNDNQDGPVPRGVGR